MLKLIYITYQCMNYINMFPYNRLNILYTIYVSKDYQTFMDCFTKVFFLNIFMIILFNFVVFLIIFK